ncbi:RNA polymerase sigma factor [Sediminibacterium roseum]|uniref:RNA polymerase sigma factor n=1 Tax=Sediminibacterium roseum TaxID=1978412 RepID=A0ABW9ZW55_9BACT|nr:RNA polymerase sigma factor [Sediminibacterium roseum]NCI50464.1 RNA polymerase sigma factor [Sediminibacterium roseum]
MQHSILSGDFIINPVPQLNPDMTVDTLVERCVKGDRDGFRLLYNHYAKAMYNTALRIVNNAADAEDILQEAFSDAFRSLESFRNRSTFGAWLKRIVINKSINKVKRERKRWVEVDMESIDGYQIDEPEIDEDDFVYKVESIKQAMKQLPDGYRTVLSLHLVENYKHEEIAGMLGIAHATVRTQYIRAKKKLLEIISQNNLS